MGYNVDLYMTFVIKTKSSIKQRRGLQLVYVYGLNNPIVYLLKQLLNLNISY